MFPSARRKAKVEFEGEEWGEGKRGARMRFRIPRQPSSKNMEFSWCLSVKSFLSQFLSILPNYEAYLSFNVTVISDFSTHNLILHIMSTY